MHCILAVFVIAVLIVRTGFFVSSTYAAAGINQTINFQGKLVDNNGLNVANGNYDIIFYLYAASSGGSALWTETWNSGTTQVAVQDGVFRVALGTHTVFTSFDFNTDSLYLAIKVGADAEMTPRIRFTSVPYAFVAKTVVDDALDFAQLQDTLDVDANLTVNQTGYTWTQTYTGTSAPGLSYTASGAVTSGNSAALDINASNASTTVPAMMLTNAGSGFALRINDDGTTTDSTPFVIDAAGQVGIGTTAPEKLFHVQQNIDTSLSPAIIVRNASAGTSAQTRIQLFNNSGTNPDVNGFALGLSSSAAGNAAMINNYENGPILFYNKWTELARITNTGNVGIGTTSPVTKLEVNQSQDAITYSVVKNANTGGSAGAGFGSVSDTASGYIVSLGSGYTLNGAFVASRTLLDAVTGGGISLVARGSASSDIRLFTGGYAAGNERVRIDNNGNVGIATTAPASLLDVHGTTWLRGTTGGTSGLYVNSSGNVGVGTTNPSYKLDVNGTLRSTGAATFNSTGSFANTVAVSKAVTGDFIGLTIQNLTESPYTPTDSMSLSFLKSNGSSMAKITSSNENTGSYYNGYLALWTKTSDGAGVEEKMRITSNGNVGIGTTSPAVALEVGGSGNVRIGGLTASLGVYTDANKQLTSTAPTSGSIGFWSRATTTLSPATANDIVSVATTNTTGADLAVTNTGIYTGTGIVNLTAGSLSSGVGMLGSFNGLTTGTGLSLSSTSTAGTGSNNSKMLNIARSGTNSNASHTAYGLFSTVTNTGTTSTNVAGYFSASGATNNYGLLVNAGNVGIGTTSPGAKLVVHDGLIITESSDTNTSITLNPSHIDGWAQITGVSGSGADWGLGALDDIGTDVISFMSASNSDIVLAPYVTERFRVTTSGNVGIGTTAPQVKLHVDNSANSGINEVLRLSYANAVSAGAQIGFYAGSNVTKVGQIENVIDASGGDSSLRFYTFKTGVGLGERVRIDNNGNVGIGTTGPGFKLDIQQSQNGAVPMRVQSATAYSGILLDSAYTSDANTRNWYVGGNNYAYGDFTIRQSNALGGNAATAGTDRLYISNTGNVGIGTTSPVYALTLESGQLNLPNATKAAPSLSWAGNPATGFYWRNGSLEFSLNNAATVQYNSTGIVNGGSLQFAGGQVDAVSPDVYLSRSAANTLKVSSDGSSGAANFIVNGNVGIGTTSPTYKLDVNGSGRFQNPNGYFTFEDYGIAGYLKVGGDANVVFSNADNANRGYYFGGQLIDFTGTTYQYMSTQVWNGAATLSKVGNYIQLGIASSGVTFNVKAGVGQTANIQEWQNSSGTPLVLINNIGNVGIGTTAPVTKLQIMADTSDGLRFARSDGTWPALIETIGNGSLHIRPALDSTTLNTYGLWVQSGNGGTAGYVGIGTTGPIDVLNVAGDQISVSQNIVSDTAYDWLALRSNRTVNDYNGLNGEYARIYFRSLPGDHTTGDLRIALKQSSSSTKSDVFTVRSSGNVGIGTTNPTSKLQVAGTISPSADDTYDLGTTALRFQDLYLGPATLHIGTSTTDEGLLSYDTTNNIFNFGTDATANGGIAFFTDDLYLEKASSYIGIGTTDPAYTLDLYSGDSQVASFTNGNGTCLVDIGKSGFDCSSDKRLKKNIETMSAVDNLSKISALRPVTYAWKNQTTDEKHFGLIAQELETIFPELVSTDKNGFKLVSYGSLTPIMISAIQEQQRLITFLQSGTQEGVLNTDIATISGRLDTLDTKVSTWDSLFISIQSIIQSIQDTMVAIQNQLGLVQSEVGATREQIASLSASLTSITDWKEAMSTGSAVLGATDSAMLDKVATISSLLVKDKLQVDGKATMFDLSVLNKLTAGTIVLGAGIDGDEINSSTGIRFQTLAQGPIDFMNGKVVINVDGSVEMTHLKLSTADPDKTTLGTATIPAGHTSMTITNSSITGDSMVFITPTSFVDKPIYVNGKIPGVGFVITISSPAVQDIQFQWMIVN